METTRPKQQTVKTLVSWWHLSDHTSI